MALEPDMCTRSPIDDALHAFIAAVTHVDMHREPGPQLVELVRAVFGFEAVAIFDADTKRVHQAGDWAFDPDNFVRNIYIFEKSRDDVEMGLCSRVLRVGNFPVGALLLRGEVATKTGTSVAALCALTFDRYHSYANVGRTESARQTEQLRTTVLNSLAHAYKTPLTAIQAASTGLGMMEGLSAGQRDLLNLIDEQTNLLNELTTRLLKTAQLEAQDISLKWECVEIAPLLDDVLAACREQLADVVVQVNLSQDDLALTCDRELLIALLTQYVENAGKYSIAGSTVDIAARNEGGELIFSVSNAGPEIAANDRERVFDLYFRCAETASATPGTGVGLSIAKRAAQAHGGDVWVTSSEGRTTFFASLPIEGRQETQL
ncbi:MAG: hypothetical protein JSS87_06320 [Acidobacteria bacterium]|nr:hypothetical protein [Acidobacteriota bacterium]